MKPIIDLDLEYGLVLEGGGARGAYQIGAWKALHEVGVKINAIAGTSVGALNGALICMGNVEKAEAIWEQMTYSKVMEVDDEWMFRYFDKKLPFGDVLNHIVNRLKTGGIDVSPLRQLIHEMVDEEKVRTCGIAFYLLAFSVDEMRELDLSIEDIPEGYLEDFLLASAYLLGFKRERLHGVRYMDGGVVNNVPTGALVKRGYKHIIEIRIYGPGREPRVKVPVGGLKLRVAPRVRLGSIIDFSPKRSRQNIKIGYYDAMRMIYGLEGRIYYLEQTHEDEFYTECLTNLSEPKRAEVCFMLKIPLTITDKGLFLALLEASAKRLRVQKYRIYQIDEFYEIVKSRYDELDLQERDEQPKFMEIFFELEDRED
ncbi:putative acylesterase/phospholipase RssA [Lachnospiraceae bacterium PF1-21]|uniref:patatin-like phospholipase family protein n=1 Tax=Ohessyouella blattaphilus TaxID=2949333 RepID=UPI003E2BC630